MGKLTVFALLLAAGLAGCAAPEPEETESAVRVETAEVERGDIHRIIKLDGVLYPVNQANIVPKISAPIRALHADRGDRVRKGQLLAELESLDLAAAAAESRGLYTQAEAEFESTTAASLPEEIQKAEEEASASRQAMEAAEKVLQSRQELFRQGALAQRTVDEANANFVQARSQFQIAQKHLESLRGVGQQTTVKNAEGQLEAAKAQADAAQVQLSYSQIFSPIDGVVSNRPLFVGEMASAGSPLITVMDVSRVIARAKAPGDQLQFIKVGNPATISVGDGSVQLPGKVTVISPALDPNSTTVEVWIEAENPNGQLHPGDTSKVSIVTETVADATLVPGVALLPSDEGKSVVLVVGPDSIAHEREIEIGIREGDKVQIINGIEPGDSVVIGGGLGLEDGAQVVVQKAEDEK